MTRSDGTLATLPRLAVIALVALGAVLALADPFTIVFFVSYALVGTLLVFRRPRTAVSWLLLGIAIAIVGTTSAPGVDVAALLERRAPIHYVLWAWWYSWSGFAVFLAFAALAFVFPSGRLPAGRGQPVAIAALAAGALVTVLATLAPTFEISLDGVHTVSVPNPFAVAPELPVWPAVPTVALAVVVVGFALGVLSMLARYRSASDDLRLQLRWLLAAIAAVLVGIVLALALSLTVGDRLGGLVWLPAVVAYPMVPLAIAVAIFRYRLYEIDRIVNRALVYGALTAILAGVFAALTTLSQRLFIVMTGQTSDAAFVLTTLAVATLYAPVRRRVEAAVDRVFKYEERQFGAYRAELTRLLELVDPIRAAARLAREVADETDAVGAAVVDAAGAVIASAGTWPTPEPIRVDGDRDSPFRAVLIGRRRDGRAHDPQHLAAVADILALAEAAVGERPAAGATGSPTTPGDLGSPIPAAEDATSVTIRATGPHRG